MGYALAMTDAIAKPQNSTLQPGDPALWYGPEMAKRQDAWAISFTSDEIAELRAAAEAFLASGKPLEEAKAADFDLPRLAAKLKSIADDVIWGRGFVLLRGIPVEEMERDEQLACYWAVGLQVGVPVSQNAMGHLLGHVKDIGKDPADPAVRIYQTSFRQIFHTDSTDIVGLLCLKPARSGGLSAIVSSTTIYHEMKKTRPDLVEVLEQPFYYDRKGEVPPGKASYYQLPVFHWLDGQLSTIYARDFIDACQRLRPEVPRLTPLQIEALDEMDRLAGDERLRLDMDFQPGDIQLLHNHQILHARTAYEDWPEPERRRHLLRLWLSTPTGRVLPKAFEERYGEIVPGEVRGGIRVEGVRPHIAYEAEDL